jgi:hypothetical protein
MLMKIQTQIILKLNWLLTLAIACLLTLSSTSGANAAPPGVDFFSINSPKQNSIGSKAGNHAPTPAPVPVVTWFSKYDDLRDKYNPTDGDRVILTRPLMQEAERVQQWTNTANKIAKNYLLLAQAIRKLPLPSGASDVKEYRDLMADWYQDAAGVYEDLVRPRPPARTIEDLQEQLEVVKKRSESLANNIANLKAMDRSLRLQYSVNPPLQDDVIQKFIRSK